MPRQSTKGRTAGARRARSTSPKVEIDVASPPPPMAPPRPPGGAIAPALRRILDDLYLQGFADAQLAELKDDDVTALELSNGRRLTKPQQVLVRAHVAGLKRDVAAAAAAAQGRRKVRPSEFITFAATSVAAAARETLAMVGALRALGSNLDVAFVLDGTGSMKPHLSAVVDCVQRVAVALSETAGMTARFGVVVYRDHADKDDRLWYRNFGSAAALADVLRTVTAQGGGDFPEDCFGGLMLAATALDWRAPARVIVWIGDAPQHGSKYNGGVDDSYPDGCPLGVTAEQIFSACAGQGISVVFGKLGKYTDAMTQQLQRDAAPYGSTLFTEFAVGGDMGSFLLKSVTATSAATHKRPAKSAGYTDKPYRLVEVPFDAHCPMLPPVSAEVIRFGVHESTDLHPLLDLVLDGPTATKRNVTLQMTEQPAARGEFRIAFFGLLQTPWYQRWLTGPDRCVLKESRFEGAHNTRDALRDQAHVQIVANFLASVFTRKAQPVGLKRRVSYVPVELVRVPSLSTGRDFFTMEPYIQGKYEKFNNNNGFVDRVLEAQYPELQAFSHFTYEYSGGVLMVTDLQGVAHRDRFILTDPAIHTMEPEKTLRDPTNLGAKGFAAFLATHTCGPLCRALGLSEKGVAVTSAAAVAASPIAAAAAGFPALPADDRVAALVVNGPSEFYAYEDVITA